MKATLVSYSGPPQVGAQRMSSYSLPPPNCALMPYHRAAQTKL